MYKNLSIVRHREGFWGSWGGMGLDNMFFGFCQIFLDKLEKILSNISSLKTYIFNLSIYVTGVERILVKFGTTFYYLLLLFAFLTGVSGGLFGRLNYPQLHTIFVILKYENLLQHQKDHFVKWPSVGVDKNDSFYPYYNTPGPENKKCLLW